jgi:NIPSNAP
VATTLNRYDGDNVPTSYYAASSSRSCNRFKVHTIIMIIEMRTYRTKPGKRDEFLRIFRTKSVPAHLEIGMKILGPFLSVEDPDVFFFMRGFPDLASREPMRASFYEGELWKEQLEGVLLPLLEKYDVVLVDDPANLLQFDAQQNSLNL